MNHWPILLVIPLVKLGRLSSLQFYLLLEVAQRCLFYYNPGLMIEKYEKMFSENNEIQKWRWLAVCFYYLTISRLVQILPLYASIASLLGSICFKSSKSLMRAQPHFHQHEKFDWLWKFENYNCPSIGHFFLLEKNGNLSFFRI